MYSYGNPLRAPYDYDGDPEMQYPYIIVENLNGGKYNRTWPNTHHAGLLEVVYEPYTRPIFVTASDFKANANWYRKTDKKILNWGALDDDLKPLLVDSVSTSRISSKYLGDIQIKFSRVDGKPGKEVTIPVYLDVYPCAMYGAAGSWEAVYETSNNRLTQSGNYWKEK
jgi:hypothetical protein